MNPSLLSFLLRTALGSSASLTPGQANPALWGSPAEFPIGETKEEKKPDPQIDRIKQAFEALKDMHKGPNQTAAAFTTPPSSGPSPFDSAQWPYGPVALRRRLMPAALPQHAPMPDAAPCHPAGQPGSDGLLPAQRCAPARPADWRLPRPCRSVQSGRWRVQGSVRLTTHSRAGGFGLSPL
jgi:hypothetical protein